MINAPQSSPRCLISHLRSCVRAILCDIVPDLPSDGVEKIEVTLAREAQHGDFATNAALIAAKAARIKPLELAARLSDKLRQLPEIAKADVAGPGFVNLTLKPNVFQSLIPTILTDGLQHGASKIGAGLRVNVEYVSANPTGPMHVGHCRGAVVGDALANLLIKTGHSVTKEYYINDAGAQVIALTWAVYWRYLQAIGTTMSEDTFIALTPTGLQYTGDYLKPVAKELMHQHGDALSGENKTAAPVSRWFDLVRETALKAMMAQIRQDLSALGITHDVFSSEAKVLTNGAVDTAIARLEEKGLLYVGVLEAPKGKVVDEWEARPQTLFRSTAYGDDVDRALRKSDGSNTYFANDIGYHAQKAEHADVLIDVLGADHGGYVTRMRAAVAALTEGACQFEAVMCQIVKVMKSGQALRMSKRAGTFVTLRDLLDEVGRDAVRFTMLTRKADAQMDFDLDAVVAQTRDNPVFYVQYAHARCCSVLRMAKELFGAAVIDTQNLARADLSSLHAEHELAVLRRIATFPRLLEGAALAREPHRVAFFCGELAAEFHALWHKGRDDTALRFLQAHAPEESRAKVALVACVATTLRCAFQVLGVTPVEEM